MKLVSSIVAVVVVIGSTSFAQKAADFAGTKWSGKDKAYPLSMTLEIDQDLKWTAVVVDEGRRNSYKGELVEVTPMMGGKAGPQNPLAIVLDKAQDVPALAIKKNGRAVSLSYDTLTLERK
jgi:hypothetical protein